jgi:hypothetical protein
MKEKETWEQRMTEINDEPHCARAEDLVSYLYGEADEAASESFLAHTRHCASCRMELAAFGNVRASIGEWRGQALGVPAQAAVPASNALIAQPNSNAPARARSALAALREFFALSPAWMRAATAALGLVFCALVALAVAHYLEQPKIVTVEKSVQAQASESDLAPMTEERLKAQSLNAPPKPEAAQPDVAIKTTADADKLEALPKANPGFKRSAARQSNLASNRKPRLSISPQESKEIARDLRLTIASNDEDDLPRLSDLMDESN